jgi:hypothetical protein
VLCFINTLIDFIGINLLYEYFLNPFKGITPRCLSLIRAYLIEGAWVALRLEAELQAEIEVNN